VGMVFLKVDRNPGRVIVACRELYGILHRSTFLGNPRYIALDLMPSAEDVNFGQNHRDSFKEAVPGCQQWMGRKLPVGARGRVVIGLSSRRA